MRLLDVDLNSEFIINSYAYDDKRFQVKRPYKMYRKTKEEEYQSDSSEELQYGPGIVNKLKSKYLSLTLRESQRGRPSLASLRRATSLENILDEEVPPKPCFKKAVQKSKVSQYCARYQNINKGNELIKRAQSMDALYRNEKLSVPKSVTIERMSNGCEEKPPQPKVDPSKELPPPDLVKQTLKIFEKASQREVPKCKAVKPVIKDKKKLPVKPMISPKPVFDKPRKPLMLIKEVASPPVPPRKEKEVYTVVVPPLAPPVKPEGKYVSPNALENIGKEGSTMRFSFGTSTDPKPYLPAQATNTALLASKDPPAKQVAVIRPVVNKPLTELEMEKNLINTAKTEQDNPEKISLWSNASWQNKNTVVFNFVDRPVIPDYVENDGLSLNKDKSKWPPADGRDESDDADLSLPSVNIVGGNVIINGRSSLSKHPKQHKLRIQFREDALTTLFEYPREDSPPSEETPCSPLLPGMGGLCGYTPSKTASGERFELGVSRAVTSDTRCVPEAPPPADPDTPPPTPWSHETTSDILF